MSNSTSSKLVDSLRRAKDPKNSDEKPEQPVKTEEKQVEKPKTKTKSQTNSEEPRRIISSSRTWPD
ncbi:MAG TPA: hypothetical protein ENK73_09230 [Thiomicrospira sp.]|jgi:hypothetical protein|nr:hypothetical protein [Thiomicrospira sp.]